MLEAAKIKTPSEFSDNFFFILIKVECRKKNSHYTPHTYIMKSSKEKMVKAVFNGDIMRQMVPAGFKPVTFLLAPLMLGHSIYHRDPHLSVHPCELIASCGSEGPILVASIHPVNPNPATLEAQISNEATSHCLYYSHTLWWPVIF